MLAREAAAVYKTKKKKFTYQDYLNLPEDGKRYEVIEGELVMVAAPNTIHQMVSANLEYEMRMFVKKHKSGILLDAPTDVYLDENNVVQPDILFISEKNKSKVTEKNISGAPDLAVEILSPSTAYHDLVAKKDVYEQFGVKEYWIVDPKRSWVEIFTLKTKKFQLHQRLEKEGVLKSKLLKGFEVSLKTLFETNF